jgi:hypothetical protein
MLTAADAAAQRSLISVYSTAEVDAIIGGLTFLTSSQIDTLGEINAIIGDADLVSQARTITAGTGLSGGGDLSANRTISLANTAVTAGSYTAANITVDAQGRITAAANGSSATPGGSSGQVQFNNAGAFGGMTAVVYAATGTHVAITSQGATIVPLCVKGSASQSGNLQEWQNSSGTILFRIDASGNLQMPLSATTYIGSIGANATFSHSNFVSVCRSGDCYGTQFVGGGNQGSYYLRNDISAAGFGWGAYGTTSIGSPDTKISRNAAGVVEINNGTNGTFRDLIVRNLRMSAPTLVPASASATGSEGQFAWDANYIYICVATNTWKRVAIATW